MFWGQEHSAGFADWTQPMMARLPAAATLTHASVIGYFVRFFEPRKT
jgi:hypothetical protein